MDATDIMDLLFHALVDAADARIADVTQSEDGILLTTTHGERTQAWRIQRSALTETVPAEESL